MTGPFLWGCVDTFTVQVVFLSLFNVPGIGTTWLDYVLPLACLLAVPFILPVHMDIYNSISTLSTHYLGGKAPVSDV